MFCGRGMAGGSGGGGGGMLRSVGRAVTRVGVSGNGMQDPISSSTASATTTATANSSSRSTSPTSKFTSKPKSSSHLSLSSPISRNINPVSGLPFWYSSPEEDDYEWVSNNWVENEGFNGFSGTHANVPSKNEVEDAVYALQQVFGPTPTSHVQLHKENSKLDNDDWKEPSLPPYNSGMQLSNVADGVYHAFHLLHTDASVQRMVKSISSDKTVWDAVLNNEVVRELRESFSSDEEKASQITDGNSSNDSHSTDGTSGNDSHSTTNVVMWIFDSARAKFMDMIEKITKIVTDLFQPAVHKTDEDAKSLDPFNEKLRASFMLSIMVLLVVVMSRAHHA